MSVKKRGILLWVLFLGVIFLNGCETAKGAAYGAAKDTANLWQAIQRADTWMKKNLW